MAKSDNITEIGQAYHALYHNIAVRRAYGYGVIDGCNVSATGSLSVDVSSGQVLHDGDVDSITADTVALAGADGSDPRKDIIVWDGSGLDAITGTPQPIPADQSSQTRFDTYQPSPPDATGGDYTVLAELWVPAGASALSSSDINDLRTDPAIDSDEVRVGTATIGESFELPTYADNTNAVQEDAEVWFNDGSGVQSAGIYYYDADIIGPLEAGSGSTPSKLSGLEIDTNKDWGGYDITNVGSVSIEELSNIAKTPDNLSDIRTHLSAGGLVVDPKQGTYQVEQGSPIKIASNTTLLLREGVKFESADSNNVARIFENDDTTNGNTNIKIIGLGGQIDGKQPSGEQSNNRDGIALVNCSDCAIKGVNIRRAGYMGIWIAQGGENNEVVGCDVRESGHHNIECRSDNSIIAQNRFAVPNQYDNIQLDTAGGCVVANNRCSNADRYNITVMSRDSDNLPENNTIVGNNLYNGNIELGSVGEPFTSITISGNVIQDGMINNRLCTDAVINSNRVTAVNRDRAILIGGDGDRTVVIGNYCKDATDQGITANPDKVLISENVIRNSTNEGLEFNGSHSIISNNMLIENGATAIYENGGDSNAIFGNLLADGAQDTIAYGGSNTIVKDNVGYVTENGGETSVDNGGTIAHGLDGTPTVYAVESRDSGQVAQITGVDSTNLTVEVLNVSDGSGAGTGNKVSWEAKVR